MGRPSDPGTAMWGLTKSARVFLRSGVTDLRLGFDGLSALVKTHLGQDLLSGGLFVFCNRSRTRVKVLTFDFAVSWNVLFRPLHLGSDFIGRSI